jgi:hypothetical protein
MNETETESFDSYQKRGAMRRTWADVFVSTTYMTAGLIFLIVLAVGSYFILGKIPGWFWISIFGSFLFIPFLQERAKDGADLFLITDEPFKLTEYRIGKNVGLEIEGIGTRFQSETGVSRIILNSLDKETMKAEGSAFGSLTPIDQVRDLQTLDKLTKMLESTLKESRISAQTVGVEVEKQSIEIVDWALKTIYGSIIPNEISESFGIQEEEKSLDVELETDTILEDLS